jgi:hypothetical protein
MFIITNSAVRFPFLHMLFITIVVSTSLDHLHFCLLDSHQTLGTEDFFLVKKACTPVRRFVSCCRCLEGFDRKLVLMDLIVLFFCFFCQVERKKRKVVSVLVYSFDG